jgi:hypothetical protein
MANLYKKLGKASQVNKDGGYKPEVWFAPKDTITNSLMPAPGSTPVLGDAYKIALAHTFGSGDGFINLTSKLHSVTHKSTSKGDDGVQQLEHMFEFELIGDSAELLELRDKIQNEEGIWLIKDANCTSASAYDQFGDSCVTPVVKVEFDAKTTKEGVKVTKCTGTITGHKYFYSGAVTEKP